MDPFNVEALLQLATLFGVVFTLMIILSWYLNRLSKKRQERGL
jgi:hypothetical protein